MKVIKFILKFNQNGKGFTMKEFYNDVHDRLIKKRIATNVSWGSNPRPPLVDNEIIHVEIPYTVKNDVNPSNLTIENIEKALYGLLDKYDSYSNLQIEV